MAELRNDFITLRPLHVDYVEAYLAAFSATVKRALHVEDISSEIPQVK